MKIHFEMEFEIDNDQFPPIWTLYFTYDDREGEILFNSVAEAPASSSHSMEWEDFLKMIGKQADGEWVNELYKLAESHVDLNLHDAYQDEE